MAMMRFNPFNEMLNIQREMNRLFESVAPSRRDSTGGYDSAVWRPMVDVHEDENSYQIDVELPGLAREDVKINYQDGTLSISGERRYRHEEPDTGDDNTQLAESVSENEADAGANGDTATAVAKPKSGTVQKGSRKPVNVHRVERFYGRFYRSFTFPTTVDADNIKATFSDGVLNVSVPKAEEVKPRQIQIG